MTTLKRMTLCLAAVTLLAMPLQAQDSTKHEMPGEMPPMGPPAQMQELAWLVGDWDVAGKMRMTPDGEWMDYTAKSSYEYRADGAVLEGHYEMPFSGHKMIGAMWQTYDREKEEWQTVWVDNMMGRMSMYTGHVKDDKSVMVGEDMMGGQTFLSRITTYDHTDTEFLWKMEHSVDGGKTWWESMTATYSKL